MLHEKTLAGELQTARNRIRVVDSNVKEAVGSLWVLNRCLPRKHTDKKCWRSAGQEIIRGKFTVRLENKNSCQSHVQIKDANVLSVNRLDSCTRSLVTLVDRAGCRKPAVTQDCTGGMMFFQEFLRADRLARSPPQPMKLSATALSLTPATLRCRYFLVLPILPPSSLHLFFQAGGVRFCFWDPSIPCVSTNIFFISPLREPAERLEKKTCHWPSVLNPV